MRDLKVKIPAWSVSILAISFLIVAWGAFRTWPTEIFNYDLIHDFQNAVNLIRNGQLPVHGSIASFGVFNPPGVVLGLLPGALVFSHEPVLAMKLGTIGLSALSLVGLFLILNKRFGPGVAVWGCLLYLISTTGWYFMGSMRPRAHPVFLIWVVYFIDLLIVERRGWAIFPLIISMALGMYWMLEIAPLFLAVSVILIIYRPRINWKLGIAGIVLAVLIWVPYLKFQAEREFEDLRTLVIDQEPAHNFAKLFFELRTEKGLERTKGHRAHPVPGLEPEQKATSNDKPVNPDPVSNLSPPGLFRQLSWTFPDVKVSLVPAVYLLLSFIALLLPLTNEIRRFLNKPEIEDNKTYLILWVTTFICWGIVFVLSRGDPEHVVRRRFFWLWAIYGPVLVVAYFQFLESIISGKTIRRVLQHAGMALLVIGTAFNPSISGALNSIRFVGLGTTPRGEFYEVIDVVASEIMEHDLPPRIGYDIPFLAWLISVRAIDGTSSVGIQYDMYFKFHYGIENLNKGPFSVHPDDTMRIVEHGSQQPWRQSYMDLSDYPEMVFFKQLDDYTILVNSRYADQVINE